MKKRSTLLIYATITVLMLSALTGNGQSQSQLQTSGSENYRVIRGERPPVDLNNVSEDAYEKGKIKIKIAPELEGDIPFKILTAGNTGCVNTGIGILDALNTKYNVKSYKPLFMDLYATGSKTSQYAERHKAWGFQRWFVLEIDRNADVKAAVLDYSRVNGIEWAEPEYKKILITEGEPREVTSPAKPLELGDESKWTPNDPWFPYQWNYKNTGQVGGTSGADLDMENAWNITKGNPNVIVAVLDQGVQTDHSELQNNIWSGVGYNFVTGSTTLVPADHGTFVAGIIAATSNNGTGISGIAGGSGAGTGVKIMCCQIFSGELQGGFETAPVYAADNGAAISQNSWSYTEPFVYDQSVLDAIDYFAENGGGNAMDGGISFFSSGNFGSNALYYPGCYPGCTAIAATTNQDKKTSYSNYGAWVDLSAPGGTIQSQPEAGIISTINGNLFGWWEGTSFSCPHVSGVAALMLSLGYGVLSADVVADVLKTTSENIDALNPGYAGELGTGRVNANNALVLTQTILSLPQNPVTFTATAVSPNQVNLAWQKNASNNNVMIVWNETGTLGIPQQGVSYNIGDVIPGGGSVLYKGSNTSFQHTNLPNGSYCYYKIFSYSSFPNYSYGRVASAVTSCQSFSVLPINQDFNTSTYIPDCWTVVDHIGNGQNWKFGSFGGGLGGNPVLYAFLNSDQYGYGYTQDADLITPKMNLSNYMNVTLTFKHYFFEFEGSSATLSYSIDDGVTWTAIQTWTTSTANPATFSQQINSLDCQPSVRFKWNYKGTFAMWWCIDDVAVTGVTPAVPYVNFSATPTSIKVSEPVVFTDASGGSPFTNWQWNFGQGAFPATATGRGPHTVTYGTTGTKTVSLTVDGTYNVTKTNYITVSTNPNVVSATYSSGDIQTDFAFQSLPGASSCPGGLTANLPLGAVITGVDVQYSMTASGGGFLSEQRSQLRCISSGGLAETHLASGSGENPGTFNYYRSGLTIANNVTGGGPVVFELHAGRTWGGSGCTTTYNKVNNNSWIIYVHYYIPDPVPNFTAVPTTASIGQTVTFTDATTGYATSWSWNFGSGATPSTATGKGPHQVVYNTGGYKTVSLTVNGSFTKTRTNYINVSSTVYAKTATFSSGDINTDYNFQVNGNTSGCPGLMSVNIPLGATITGVDVNYNMTALGIGQKSDQRSQLWCVSSGGVKESAVYSGTGYVTGTQSYSRKGLTIANNVNGGGPIYFELHAGRTTWGEFGCNTLYNKVDNNTWSVTVYYMPTSNPVVDFTASPTSALINVPITYTGIVQSGTVSSWAWNFGSGASPATATGIGPHQVTYSTPGYKTITLTINGSYQITKTNYVQIEASNSVSATYTAGDIQTDLFDYGNWSDCPGYLTVNVPAGAIITSLDVSYSMTASGSATKAQQRSFIGCITQGQSWESEVFSGTGNEQGTQNYSRTGLTIANYVTGGGPVEFSLQAGRTWGGYDCSTEYNKVNNNSWTIKIYYEMPPVSADFTATPTTVCPGGQVQFTDLSTGGPTSWSWQFPGGTPATSTSQHPLVVYSSPGTYNVTLTASRTGSSNQVVKSNYITVTSLPGSAGSVSGEIAVCNGSITTYTVPLVTNATAYEWVVTPTEAGNLSANQNTCDVTWNTQFSGDAGLKARGNNQCGSGGWSPLLDILVIDCDLTGIPVSWDIQQTTTIHPIKILPETTISLLGAPAADGTPIGVFYLDDADAEQCGGALLYYTEQTQWLAAFGDDINTPFIDGFQTGEDFIWKVYDFQTQRSYHATAEYNPSIPNSGAFYQGSHSELLSLSNGVTLSLDLPVGWSGFSLPFNPDNTSVVDIFSECYSNLIILQRFNYMYWPAYNVNSFPAWQYDFGAQLKMNQACTLEVSGTEGNNSITLPVGWSFLAVPSMTNVSASDVFSPIESKIDIVKTIPAFQFYWPALGIYTLDVLEPGKAYFIKLNQSATITFQSDKQSGLKASSIEYNAPEQWGIVNPSPVSHLIAIDPFTSDDIEPGDFIGAFTSDGICAGFVQVNAAKSVLTVFGNDPLTDEKDGFDEGEMMVFRVLESKSGRSSSVNVAWQSNFPDHSGLFVTNGVSSMQNITLLYDSPSDFDNNISVFPNPSTGIFTITGISDYEYLEIFDVTGLTVLRETLHGVDKMTINQLQNQHGIFYLKVKGVKSSAIQKIVLN